MPSDTESIEHLADYSHRWYEDPPTSSSSKKTPYEQVAMCIWGETNTFSRKGKNDLTHLPDDHDTNLNHNHAQSTSRPETSAALQVRVTGSTSTNTNTNTSTNRYTPTTSKTNTTANSAHHKEKTPPPPLTTSSTKTRTQAQTQTPAPGEKAVHHCAEFFPFGEPDVESLRRTLEEEIRQTFHRTTRDADTGADVDVNARSAYLEEQRQDVEWMEERIAEFRKMVDEWAGTFAVCGGQKLILARPSEDTKLDFLWELNIEDDDLFHLSWSYDEYEYQPLIALAGAMGVVYIIEPGLQRIRRVLKGHGDSILSVKFSPRAPHILATASGDRTVRVWSVFGGDLAEDPDVNARSRNYPMGQADEGDACLFILAGEGPAGHRWDVVSLAFHPTKRAIVTAGQDYTVRIWALPEYPKVTDPFEIKSTPPGYHPEIIQFPVFSTSRLHDDPVDCIEWLADDILVSQTRITLIVWQWLGFARYFNGDSIDKPLPQRTDYTNSHSFRIVAKYDLDGDTWYHKFSVHQAWGEHDEDAVHYGHTTGSLLACIDGDAKPARILLFNPAHIRYPDPDTLRPPRFDGTNTEWEPIDIEGYDRDQVTVAAGQDRASTSSAAVKEEEELESSANASGSKRSSAPQIPRLLPWVVRTRGLKSAQQRRSGNKSDKPLSLVSVAISPRGAKYIVATGQFGAIVLFELKQN